MRCVEERYNPTRLLSGGKHLAAHTRAAGMISLAERMVLAAVEYSRKSCTADHIAPRDDSDTNGAADAERQFIAPDRVDVPAVEHRLPVVEPREETGAAVVG